ncbi:MAG: GTP-binding protein [Prolixibacteraceae bacterium]|jgi:G3E family GTPase|nr:GTP-binding protein [Prolixibacteraceae bacterium]
MRKIPVHIVSGFLGSGKTTFLVDLLKQKRSCEQWALIINEFGRVSVDSCTIGESVKSGEKIYELAGGCICCSASHLFRENLAKITGSGNFERIIIEPSGLGGVDLISDIISGFPVLKKMPVICMVNVFSIGEARLKINPLFNAQIRLADVILFSHCDLPEADQQKEKLLYEFQKRFPGKKYWLKTGICVEDFLLNLEISRESGDGTVYRPALHEKSTAYSEKTFTFDPEICFHTGLLDEILSGFPSVIRAKGHIRTNDGWKLVNFTRSEFNTENCTAKNLNELVIIFETSGTIDHFEIAIRKLAERPKKKKDGKIQNLPATHWQDT